MRRVGLWRSGSEGMDRDACKRRSEAFNAAFLLLGGRRAANDYLDTAQFKLAGSARRRADGSALGLIEVMRLLRRDALLPAPPIRP